MIKNFLYSKIILFSKRKKVKSKFFSLVDKETYFEGKNRIYNGDFSGSYFGFGSYSGSSLPHSKIGRFTSIGTDCHIIPANHDYKRTTMSTCFEKSELLMKDSRFYVYIGNDVWIGNGVLIKGGVTIGDGCVIGMGAVITKNIPPYSIVGGVPAKILKYRYDDTTIQRLLQIRWWDMNIDLITEAYDSDVNVFLDKIERCSGI